MQVGARAFHLEALNTRTFLGTYLVRLPTDLPPGSAGASGSGREEAQSQSWTQSRLR